MVRIAIWVKATSQNKSPFYEGCWVIAFGLTSPAGQSLNKKFGLMTKNAIQNQGRLAVQNSELDGNSNG